MATRKRLSLICEIPNFANACLGKVTKFQGHSLLRFGVLSNLLAWRWKTPPCPSGTNKVIILRSIFFVLYQGMKIREGGKGSRLGGVSHTLEYFREAPFFAFVLVWW